MKHEVRVICRKCDEAQIVYCHYKHMRELTDEEIIGVHVNTPFIDGYLNKNLIEFARAILKKAQEK
jgi:hypothetical protein